MLSTPIPPTISSKRVIGLTLSLVGSLLLRNSLSADQNQEPAPSVWQVQLLPGQTNRVFSLYGCPGNLEEAKGLIKRMQDLGLGNGFDPGPATVAANADFYQYFAEQNWPVVGYPPFGGEFQVKHGRSALTEQDERALRVMEDHNTFLAIQLGEWGYYFHELSTNVQWHRNVYGQDFEKFKGFIKPAGLDGYSRKMLSKRECYEEIQDYFLTRHNAMRGRTLSVTGHSHYESYVGEWGSRVIGLELGENIAFTQSKIAFARGAARQWGIPFSIQVSPWFAGSCTTSGPLRMETDQYARGLDAGHSLSFYKRMWLHSWFAGAALVTPENSISIFFEKGAPDWILTEHGEAAREVFEIISNNDPGIPYTPVAIILDKYAGYNAYQGRPWGTLDPTPGDQEIMDLFQHQIFPGSDHVHQPFDPENPEKTYLPATPYGEIFDVHLSNARSEVLSAYPVLILVGDHELDLQFITKLHTALRAGSQLLIHPRHAEQLGDNLQSLQGTGHVEILKSEILPSTQRPTAITNCKLANLRDTWLPVKIEGDPIQYQINQTPNGWMIELVNPAGVIKSPTQPVRMDTTQIANVQITLKTIPSRVWLLGSNDKLTSQPTFKLSIPPGETVFVNYEL
jgi:hypothetical protein